ncbi:MAG: succinate dehydrogenase, cytochrome b556 subunit [Alphaproteobacteria bacterium]|nr:succinate dehydrogenase, cytochrome b556 subunit [Alphaproteobacteria bacterium]
MAHAPERSRPLSPHLQIYKPQITSILSILHRITGVINMGGLLILAAWLIAASISDNAYAQMQWLMGSLLGMAALVVWSWTVFYHLCNGIRHLFWDMGKGFEIAQVTRSGQIVLLVSGLLTVITWAIAAQG